MCRLATFLVFACLAIAGCGGSDANSPLDEALGYLPESAPLAVIVSTDLEGDQAKAADDAVRSVPFGPLLIQQLEQQLEGGSISFDEDIKPLLGNEVVFGIADPSGLLASEAEGFVAALQAKDGGKLEDLVRTDSEEIGEAEGAKLYRDTDTFVAIKDDVLLLSDSEERLRDALEQRGADDRLREDDVDAAFEGLPEDAPVRVYANVAALLEADSGTATARRVPFVDALETLALTASLSDGGKSATLDFALNTADGKLEDEQLPIAAGEQAPPVIGQKGEIGAGIRNPAQIITFAESVAQAVSPEDFAQFEVAKRQIAQGLKLDLDRDVVAQFTGDMSIAVDLDGGFAIRSKLANPRAFERTLERLVKVIPSFAEGAGLGEVGVARPRGGESFYAVAGEDGEGVVYGVVDDVFVLANDARRAGDLASEQPRPVPGAKGAVALSADAGEIARMIISQLGGIAGALDLNLPLGELTGSLASGDSGVRGRFALELER